MSSLADAYEGLILDLDGVVYRGDQAIPGAREAIAALRERGRRIVFLTNNSARTPERVAEKLAGVGVPAGPEEVVTSAQAAAGLVSRLVGPGATAFVVGEEGVRSALSAAGVEIVDGDPARVDVVLVGWDREVDYDKLRRASVLVQRGARLVATNGDASYPAPRGELWPGAGALLAAVQTATGVRAEVAGKPHPPLFEEAVSRAGTRRALVVGDRVDTDVEGAVRAGLDAALVLTGAHTEADLLDAAEIPAAILEDLGDLLGRRLAVRVRPAGPGDRDGIRSLLEGSALDAGWLRSPGAEERAVVAGEPVSATAACEVRGRDGHLRSVAVAEELRGLNVGTLVVAAVAQRAAASGAERLFLLTETAVGFFGRLGFELVGREELPGWVLEDAARHCPPTTPAMRRELPRRDRG